MQQAGGASYRPAGEGWKRLTIWVIIVGLPLGYIFSNILPGAKLYYSGMAAYWYTGLDVRLVLVLIGTALLWYTLRRSGERWSDIGWPVRFSPWVIALFAVTLGAFLLAALNPPGGTIAIGNVPASIPVNTMERLAFLGLAIIEGVFQELLWRGAALTWLRPVIGDVAATLLTMVSFIFFYPHLALGWSGLLVQVLVTSLFTALVLWRGNVGASVYAHFVVTAAQLLAPI